MSNREQLFKIAQEATHSTEWLEFAGDDREVAEQDIADAVVSALLPEIHDEKQMKGVPEGSILLVKVQAGARAMRWEDGLLHGDLKADRMPMDPKWVISRYGPLTVVWMP
jgi:hypothetical protein